MESFPNQPRKYLFFIATILEAEEVIRTLCATKKNNDSFEFDGGSIVITGMGPLTAFFSARRAFSYGATWVNLGVVGSFDRTVKKGSVVQIGEARALHWKKSSSSFSPSRRLPIVVDRGGKAILFTAPRPVYHTPPNILPNSFVDMEGYSIAYVAKKRRIPCTLLKVVSDFCDSNTHHAILKDMPLFSSELARVAENLVLGARNHNT